LIAGHPSIGGVSESTSRPGLGRYSNADDDHAVDVWDGQVVWSFQTRARLREASLEAHGLVIDQLRSAMRQGTTAATPATLAAKVGELHHAIQAARTVHGPAHDHAMRQVRARYLETAARALILAGAIPGAKDKQAATHTLA
jgi:hypothetical protein